MMHTTMNSHQSEHTASISPISEVPKRTTNLWDRLSDEPGHAWTAFCSYCQVAPALRSLPYLSQLAASGTGQNLSGSIKSAKAYLSQYKKWSTRFQWTTRAMAYDSYRADTIREAQEQAAQQVAVQAAQQRQQEWEAMISRHSATGRALFNQAALALLGKKKIKTADGKEIDVPNLPIVSVTEGLRMLDKAVEIERLCAHHALEHNTVSGSDTTDTMPVIVELGRDEQGYISSLGALADIIRRSDRRAAGLESADSSPVSDLPAKD